MARNNFWFALCSEPKSHARHREQAEPAYGVICSQGGDAAEFVDGVEQGNESFVFRLSVFLALWTISHCEALAIGFKIELSRWMTAFTSLLLPYRPPRCTCRISR